MTRRLGLVVALAGTCSVAFVVLAQSSAAEKRQVVVTLPNGQQVVQTIDVPDTPVQVPGVQPPAIPGAPGVLVPPASPGSTGSQGPSQPPSGGCRPRAGAPPP